MEKGASCFTVPLFDLCSVVLAFPVGHLLFLASVIKLFSYSFIDIKLYFSLMVNPEICTSALPSKKMCLERIWRAKGSF